ncbi:MAG: Sec-independent protein translocase protein TatB [Gammaproteobacteria bacterium]|jgi:sec-independent protein translocase protein TatB
MFDIGFFEIVFIMVIALLVVGPERLPRVARTTGLWLGKLRGFVTSVKADIDKELAAEELKKALAKQASLPELKELIDEVTGKRVTDNTGTGQTSANERRDAETLPEPVSRPDPDDKPA